MTTAIRTNQVVDDATVPVPVPGALVYVYNQDDSLASLTSDGTTAIANPLTTDAFGNYSYYALVGYYREDIWFNGAKRWSENNVAVGSPGADLTLRSDLAAATGYQLIGGGLIPSFAPETYGAKGDGVTNDTAAMALMAAAVNAASGGLISFRPGSTYLVGSQTFTSPPPSSGTFTNWTYIPSDILHLINCTKRIIIRANGAKMICAPGLRYGTFDTTTGAPLNPATQYSTGISSPYTEMIHFDTCTGGISFSDLELDGNQSSAILGGGYGDTGRQISCNGYTLTNCTGTIVIERVYSHDHCLDGAEGDGPGILSAEEKVTHRDCRFTKNGRQGFSLVGGINWKFDYCTFEQSGKGAVSSNPGSGFDLESEGTKYVRRTSFKKCTFSDNTGAGMVSDTSANTSDAYFEECIFVGTTNWCVWPNRPRFRFSRCTFVGTMTHAYPNTNPVDAAQFLNCKFTDDVTMSPTGVVFASGSSSIYDTGGGTTNVLFDECNFLKTQAGAASNGNAGSAYPLLNNCSFNDIGGGGLSFYGRYSGERTSFTLVSGTVPSNSAGGGLINGGEAWDSYTLNGSTVSATLRRATGKKIYFASATYDPPSLAAGAKDTIHTMTVTGVALGDKIDSLSFSVDLAGARIVAWVSAANTVSYYAINENGANPLDLTSGTLLVEVAQS